MVSEVVKYYIEVFCMKLYFYNGQPTTYFITENGKCKNQKTNKWLKGQISKNGYLTYQITTNLGKKRLYAHRMVAETYLKGIKGKTEVNHKDGNKLNNNLDNLEWVTSKENKIHATDLGLRNSVLKKVYCFSEKRELIAEYRSITDASLITGIGKDQLSIACNRENKLLCHGFYWSFENDNNFSIEILESGKSKRVGKYDLKENLIQEYNSLSEAGRDNACSRTHIGECCNGKLKTYKGFIWKFI